MPETDVIVRETFGGKEVSRLGTTHAIAAEAAKAKAEIEAAFIMADRKPRDEDVCRARILHTCADPAFAEVALYKRPVGRQRNPTTGEWEDKHIIDLSIRALEAFLQHWGRASISSRIVEESREQRQIAVTVWDLQNVLVYSAEAVIDKTVERKGERKSDREYISSRENSYGELVHRYEATPEEVRSKEGAEKSKLIRDQGKRLIPRHILAEARAVIDKVIADENARDPDAAKKKVLDRFASIGISPDMLKAYLDRPVESLTPKDIAELTILFNGLKDGEFTWGDVMRMKTAAPDEPGQPEVKAEGKGKQKLKDKIAEARESVAPKTKEPKE